MPVLLATVPHVLMGALVLALFWRTFLSRKGSPPHRRHGKLYLLALLPLFVTVLPISAKALAEQGPAKAVQLVYLALVLATAGWTAWRAVKDKNDIDQFRGPVFRGLGIGLVVYGVVLMAVGIATSNVLAFGFSMIGVVFGGAMVGFLGRPEREGWWLTWHLNGVALLFAATHASFTGIVLRSIRPDWDGEILHAGTQLGTIAFAFGLRQWLGWRYEGARVRSHAGEVKEALPH